MCLKLLLSLNTLKPENRTLGQTGASLKQAESSAFPHGPCPRQRLCFQVFFPLFCFSLASLDCLNANSDTACLQAPWSSPAEVKAELHQPNCPALPGCLLPRKANPSVSSSPWPSTSCWRVPAAFINEGIIRRRAVTMFPMSLEPHSWSAADAIILGEASLHHFKFVFIPWEARKFQQLCN